MPLKLKFALFVPRWSGKIGPGQPGAAQHSAPPPWFHGAVVGHSSGCRPVCQACAIARMGRKHSSYLVLLLEKSCMVREQHMPETAEKCRHWRTIAQSTEARYLEGKELAARTRCINRQHTQTGPSGHCRRSLGMQSSFCHGTASREGPAALTCSRQDMFAPCMASGLPLPFLAPRGAMQERRKHTPAAVTPSPAAPDGRTTADPQARCSADGRCGCTRDEYMASWRTSGRGHGRMELTAQPSAGRARAHAGMPRLLRAHPSRLYHQEALHTHSSDQPPAAQPRPHLLHDALLAVEQLGSLVCRIHAAAAALRTGHQPLAAARRALAPRGHDRTQACCRPPLALQKLQLGCAEPGPLLLADKRARLRCRLCWWGGRLWRPLPWWRGSQPLHS